MSQTISSGDSPATARSKFNSNATLLDATTAATAAETARALAAEAAELAIRAAADTVETAARIAAVAVEANRAMAAEVAESAARAAADDLEAATRAIIDQQLDGVMVNPRHRPGDNPWLFTSTLTGPATLCTPLSGLSVPMAYATALRVTGATIIGMRIAQDYDASRVYALRATYARFATPSDPSGDSVRVAIRWLDQNLNTVGTDTALDTHSATAVEGQRTIVAQIMAAGGTTPPAGSVYFRPYIQTFGSDGVTDILVMSLQDITDSGAYSPDLTAALARISSLETTVATLNPLTAGGANGLATLNGSGFVPLSELSIGTDKQITYNDGGIAAAALEMTWNKTLKALAIAGAISMAAATNALSMSPVGNPTVGGLLTTYSAFNLMGASSHSSNREFLAAFGMTNALGEADIGVDGNGDKVTLYLGMVTAAGAGDSWAFNPLLAIGAGTGLINGQVIEADLNILNGHDYHNMTSTPGQFSGPLASGITISGYDGGSGGHATAALLIASANAGYFNRGICVNGDSIAPDGAFLADHANNHKASLYISGRPTYGILQTDVSVANKLAGSLEVDSGASFNTLTSFNNTDATGGQAQILISNFSTASNITKAALMRFSVTDTLATSKDVGFIKSNILDVNAQDSNIEIGVSRSNAVTTGIIITHDTIRQPVARTPASASATGDVGEMCWDSTYFYRCVATNTWKRIALATW